MLTLLAQGPRFYSASFRKLIQLEKRGYTVLTGVTAFDGAREWAITAAGLAALEAYGRGADRADFDVMPKPIIEAKRMPSA
ncbi:hypothetical protein MKK55_00685 [Methylobacterium sp. J-059]|uniref:hypothetical protein n=1 Tax=Methylobacterium sp. J-059 TaxID=2836643 RepID=UPI001FB97AA6|nr:hypothetical protein [Methylobacterium sp. J-059]MCJ2037484.1 hypothetical protein [Methylobacterium sp. J-059]